MSFEPLSEKRFRRQLFVLSLILSMLVLAGAGMYFQFESKKTFKNRSRGITVIAGMKADQLVQWNKERLSEVRFFSTSEPLTNYVHAMLAGDDRQLEPFRKALLHIMTGDRYENISLFDTRGVLLFSVEPSRCHIDEASLQEISTVVRTNTIVHRDFHVSILDGLMRNYYFAPVCNPDGQVAAVMLFLLNPTGYIFPLLNAWPSPSETGESYLVRCMDDHIEYLSPVRGKVDSTRWVHPTSLPHNELYSRIMQQQEGLFRGLDYRQTEVLADIRRIDGTDWWMITKVDTHELYGTFYQLKAFILLSTAVILLLLWVSMAWIYKNRRQKMYRELESINLDLKQAKEVFSATLYSIGDGVITTDQAGMVMRLNAAAELLTGWKEQEAIGQTIESVFPLVNESTKQPENNPVRNILNNMGSSSTTSTSILVSKSGRELLVAHSVAPILLDKGGLFGVVLVFRDSTEERNRRRLVETRLRLVQSAITHTLQHTMELIVREVNQFTQSEACFFLLLSADQQQVQLHASTPGMEAVATHDPTYFTLKLQPVWSTCVNTRRPHLYIKPANASLYPSDHPLAFIEQALVIPVLRNKQTVAVLGVVNKKNSFLPDDLDSMSFLADVAWEVAMGKINYDQLQASERKYKALIDNMNDTVWLLDLNGRLLDVNKAAEALLGYSKEEILQLGMEGIDASFDRSEIGRMAQRMPKDVKQVFETVHKTKNGKLIPVEVSSNLVEYNGVQTIVSIARDISPRRREEGFRHLLYEIARFSLTTNTFEDLMVVVHTELGNVLDAEHLYVALYDPVSDQLKRLDWAGSEGGVDAHPLDMGLVYHVFTTGVSLLLSSNDRETFQARHRVHLQEPASVCWLGVPLTDGRTRLGVLVLQHFNDPYAYDEDSLKVLETVGHELSVVLQRQNMIRDLIQSKNKAEESDRLKTAFLANVSHEIRTPMNGILGFMEMLGDPDLEPEQRESYLDIVKKSGHRLLATINDIVEISKIEAGLVELHPCPLNLTDMMLFEWSFFKKEADDKGLSLILEEQVQRADALIVIDRYKLEAILSNLLNNALKFTPAGSVVFGNRIQEGKLLLYVRDTGIGIEPAKQELIFQRFVQADLSNTRPYEGAGLGLSIVQAYVEKMGGRVWVDSALGKGSTFYVQLPFEPANPPSEATIEKATSLLSADVPLTILVAEDDDTSFKFLDILFKMEGAIVLRAVCGEEAVRLVNERPDIDLVLMDVKMPGMNGLEATQRIRTFNTAIPIIAQTAYAFDKDKDDALKAGCTDFLSKPVKRQRVLQIIRKYVKRRID